ncbi:uncharacterized protein N7500_009246, partial [Penicillium coprophilum]|uniref:uncharacterized protein n=1 Tax=Penicillium coprophilum TaxID=36646 RepID=UPI0023A21837
MALQLSRRRTRGTDPTQALKTALENFQNTLTEEQKREFRGSTTKVDITSFTVFVADIDARNSSRRTPVGPRLCPFFEAMQQFTGVVDTFVSSNPVIAALVWGGIKTAILLASNVASYFDKVTTMIMRIGKSAPTYQQFGGLYPDCIGLQRALCDFYAIIINLCVKIIEVSRRTAFQQTISSMITPFESEFKPFLDLLNEATHDIKLEVSLASKQADKEAKKLQEYDSRENSRFRPLARDFYKTSLEQQAEAAKWRMKLRKREMMELKTLIRKNLSPINHEFSLRQTSRQRLLTTAEWLQKESVFEEWKDAPRTAILWCLGTIGTGKTVLMSNVVDQLLLDAAHKSDEIVCYYFCRADNETSLSARNILGSLARQMLDFWIEQSEYETLLSMEETTRDLNTTSVVDFLLSRLEASKANKYFYVVLDGVDDCDDSQAQALAQAIVELCSSYFCFKILCAGRPGLEKHFELNKPQYRISVNEEKVRSDMDCYIDTTLDKCLDEELLILGHAEIITDIRNIIRNKADGMFLWARLCVEELCAQNCDHDILKALKHLPQGLAEFYNQKLRRVQEGRTAGQAMKILQYCGVLKRPLTVMEYREVLSLSLKQKFFDRGKLPNNMDRIINGCCGLIFVDEEEETIHYVHPSVKERLFTTNGPHTAQFDTASVEQQLGFLSMTYLDFTNFKRQLTKIKKGSGTPINPLQLGTSNLPGQSSNRVASQMARRILSHSRQLQHFSTRDIEKMAQEILGARRFPEAREEFHFLNYARAYWLNHLTDFTPDMNSDMWGLLCRCVEGDDVLECRPWDLEPQISNGRDDIPEAIQWLLAHGNYALLLYYARHQPHVLTDAVKGEIFRRVDAHNCYRYTEVIVRLTNTSKLLNIGLSHAVRCRCSRSLAMLLEAGSEIDAQVDDKTALQAAAERGYPETVETLLAAGADVNALPSELGHTALQGAAREGYLEVVKVLLATGADVNALPSEGGHTALQGAAREGYLEVVKVLLAAGADANALPSEFGYTALQGAAAEGHLEVVKVLLEARAYVNASPSGYGYTALQGATGRGHLEVVKVLLEARAHVNASPSEFGHTALQGATGGGHLEVVKALLAAGAEIESEAGRLALENAAKWGHIEVVQALLVAKADAYTRPAVSKAAQTMRSATALADAEAFHQIALDAARKANQTKLVHVLLAARPN